MKVIFLADSISSQSAGIHYYGMQLIRRIIETYPHHEYSIVASEAIEELSVPQHIVRLNDKIPMHLRWRQLWSIPNLVNKLKPDLVIEMAHFGPFRLKKSIQRATVLHDLTPILFPEYHGKLSHWMHKLLLPSIISKADYLITNSEFTKTDIRKLYHTSADKIHVVYPKFDAYQTSTPKEPKQYFLAIGTLEPRKNYPAIIDAFEQFCAESDELFELVIIGQKGWDYHSIANRVAHSKYKARIKITGFISDDEKEAYLDNAWAYINFSHYEGFGLPLLEAMNHELPLLLSDKSCFPEVAKDAALFAENPSSLKDRMLQIANRDTRLIFAQKSKSRFEYFNTQKLSLPFLA